MHLALQPWPGCDIQQYVLQRRVLTIAALVLVYQIVDACWNCWNQHQKRKRFLLSSNLCNNSVNRYKNIDTSRCWRRVVHNFSIIVLRGIVSWWTHLSYAPGLHRGVTILSLHEARNVAYRFQLVDILMSASCFVWFMLPQDFQMNESRNAPGGSCLACLRWWSQLNALAFERKVNGNFSYNCNNCILVTVLYL